LDASGGAGWAAGAVVAALPRTPFPSPGLPGAAAAAAGSSFCSCPKPWSRPIGRRAPKRGLGSSGGGFGGGSGDGSLALTGGGRADDGWSRSRSICVHICRRLRVCWTDMMSGVSSSARTTSSRTCRQKRGNIGDSNFASYWTTRGYRLCGHIPIISLIYV